MLHLEMALRDVKNGSGSWKSMVTHRVSVCEQAPARTTVSLVEGVDADAETEVHDRLVCSGVSSNKSISTSDIQDCKRGRTGRPLTVWVSALLI